jgi:hypothetical protein
MGLARGDAGSAHFEYPVVHQASEEGRLTASSNGVDQASEGRDALGVRIEVHAIFLFRDFPNVFS